jgi:hypothetical protein
MVKLDLTVQIEKKNNKIADLEKKEGINRDEIYALKQELGKVKDWAEELCTQVGELGRSPVPFEG